MNIYEFIDNKFSDDDMYRSNVARRGISRIAGKGVEQMQGGNRNREGGSMNKKSHEEELQEHINALEQKLEEEVKENIKHLGDLRYYEEVQIPELQKQLAEARAEIERLKTPMITDMREKMAALCHNQWAGWRVVFKQPEISLKPCPFCGNAPEQQKDGITVCCTNIDCCIWLLGIPDFDWNKRPE